MKTTGNIFLERRKYIIFLIDLPINLLDIPDFYWNTYCIARLQPNYANNFVSGTYAIQCVYRQ